MLVSSEYQLPTDVISFIYKNGTPVLKITTVGLDPASDGDKIFYTVNDPKILNQIAEKF
jgi:hypothetical protein